MKNSKNDSICIALTGGIACGKSFVAECFRKNGFNIFNSDNIAHGYLKKNSIIFRQIITSFDEEILDNNGDISRIKLSKIIFSNTNNLTKLNKIFYPVMKEEIKSWMHTCKANQHNGIAEIPLLFELNLHKLKWDKTISVFTKNKIIISRLKSRGLSRKDAMNRINSQWTLENKSKYADISINGSNTKEFIEKKIEKLIKDWMEIK